MKEVDPNIDGLSKLRVNFPKDEISVFCKVSKEVAKNNPKQSCKKCGGYHANPSFTLSYVGHAATRNRLLDADLEWSWEPLSKDPHGLPQFDAVGGLWIKLTVCGVTRLGYGDAQGKTGPDAIKEVIGDAIRNAAMSFGVALDLWAKSKLGNVDDDVEPELVEPAKPKPKPTPKPALQDKPEPEPLPAAIFETKRFGWAEMVAGKGKGAMKDFPDWVKRWSKGQYYLTCEQGEDIQEVVNARKEPEIDDGYQSEGERQANRMYGV